MLQIKKEVDNKFAEVKRREKFFTENEKHLSEELEKMKIQLQQLEHQMNLHIRQCQKKRAYSEPTVKVKVTVVPLKRCSSELGEFENFEPHSPEENEKV